MIPYVEQPTFEVFGQTLYMFGILVALAVITGLSIVYRRAPKFGMEHEDALDLATWVIVSGFVGSHLFSVLVYFPEQLREDPLELLRVWGSMSSFGGISGGLLGGWLAMRRFGLSSEQRWAFIDAVAFAFPFGWLFGRAGCALAHDHIGIESNHWLAVAFPAGPRFDLGLLEFLYTIPIALLFAILDRKPRPAGFFLGLFFVLYGPVRFAMDTLRVEDARYLGWTPAQFLSVAAFLGGTWILVRLRNGKL